MRGLVVSRFTFFTHMAVLFLMGYKGLSLTKLEPYLRGHAHGRVVGITFDDGYENNLTHALPILERFGFSSTCYVVSDRLGGSNAWDLENGVPQKKLMSVEQLRQWIGGDQEIGSHTATHCDLASLDANGLVSEVQDSKRKLESLRLQPQGVHHFCYPYGRLNRAAIDSVRDTGYMTATTTERGRVHSFLDADRFTLPRVLVSRTTTWFHLVLKCLTRYEDRRSQPVS
jgi:peptidoglycan/xylan/chitin deacetylase (PgdA/CDA1 family)